MVEPLLTALYLFVMQVVNICSRSDYHGLDYLAATFHRWLDEPGRLVFVARIKDRIVSLVEDI